MPCLICGGQTKNDSVICPSCLQKELAKKDSKNIPKKPSGDEIELDLDSIILDPTLKETNDDLVIDADQSEEAPDQEIPELSLDETTDDGDIELDLDSIFIENSNNTVGKEEDLTITPESPSVAEPEIDDVKANIRKKFENLRLDKEESSDQQENLDDFDMGELDSIFTETGSKPADEPEETEDLSLDFSGSGEDLSLDLDQQEETLAVETDLNLDLSETDHEPEPTIDLGEESVEEELEEEPPVILPVEEESDEDILKKNIRERLKQKIQVEEPEETKDESIDSLLDEVILDEIEEVKQSLNNESQVTTAPAQDGTTADEILISPEEPKTKPVQEIPKTESKSKENDLAAILKAKSADTGSSKNKPLIPEHPKASGDVIRGTTSKSTDKPKKRKEKKSSSSSFLYVIILLIVIGGAYAVYEFVLKEDPLHKQMMTMLMDARQKEQRGELEAALNLYKQITTDYSAFEEVNEAKTAIPRVEAALVQLREKMKVQAEVDKLLGEANSLFNRKRWITRNGNDALSKYKEVLRLDPDNAEAKNKIEEMKLGYLDLGDRALTQGNYSRAKTYYLNVLAIDPTYSEASRLVTTCETLLQQQNMLAAEREEQQRKMEEMQRQIRQRMEEEKKKQEEEARRIAEQKRLEEQRKAEEQKRLEEEKRRKAAEDYSNKILLEAQVDGNKREYVKKVKPVYNGSISSDATVIVQVIVDNNGNPETVQILKTDNQALAEFVVNTVKQFKYKPPTFKGKPCKMSLIERFSFKAN